jgi:endonuclease G, mitochondrial
VVKKKRQSSPSLIQMLRQHGLKFVLGVVATGSFAFAFGQEKIQQFVSTGTSSSSSCLTQFYNKVPPYLMRDSLNKDSYPLCLNGFNVMYSGISKTPLWVAEALTPERLSQKIPREDSFHEEDRVKAIHRATLADYRGSGYDRGHMAPNADMPNKAAQHDSFSLANMVPQAPKNNQQIWRELEEATRAIVTKQKQDVYVVTGPAYTQKKLKKIGNGVMVPNAVYKAIYIPKLGVTGAYYAPNDNSLKVNIVSICYLEEQLGINLFPGMSEEQKRNTYKLPFKATAVKANSKIEYSHWDAESQCAEDVSNTQISSLQKEFKGNLVSAQQVETSTQTATSTDEQDANTQDALLKKLIDMLLQFILQLLK